MMELVQGLFNRDFIETAITMLENFSESLVKIYGYSMFEIIQQ